jgi:drug/metabolite transporter (DMT)-like permease
MILCRLVCNVKLRKLKSVFHWSNKMEQSRRFSPVIGLLIGILSVSTASLFIRFAQEEVPSFVIAAGRLAVAVLFLAPFAISKGRREIPGLPRRTIFLLISSGLFLGLHFATWITSLEYTSVASSVVIVTTAPLWVALLSPIFLKEKITKWVILGLLISLFGSIVVGLNGVCEISKGRLVCQDFINLFNGKAAIGNGLALTGAFLSAGYLIVGRRVRNSVSLLTYTFFVYTIAAFMLIILVAMRGQTFIGYSANMYLWIAALAVIPQLIGHSSFNWALKYLSAAYVSIALLGEPIGTVILAFLFLKESPTILEIIGGISILCGILIASKSRTAKPQPADITD